MLRRRNGRKPRELLVQHGSNQNTNTFSKFTILSRIGWGIALIISHLGGLPVNQSTRRTTQHRLEGGGAPLMKPRKLLNSLKNPKKKSRERQFGPMGAWKRRTFGVNRWMRLTSTGAKRLMTGRPAINHSGCSNKFLRCIIFHLAIEYTGYD
jgi:hypothetical protein